MKKPYFVPAIIGGVCTLLTVVLFVTFWFTHTGYLFLPFIFLEVSVLGSYVIYDIIKLGWESKEADKKKLLVKPLSMFGVCFVINIVLFIVMEVVTNTTYIYYPVIFLAISSYSGFYVYEVAKLNETKKPYFVPAVLIGVCALLAIVIFITLWFTKTMYLFFPFIFLEISVLVGYAIYEITKLGGKSEGKTDKKEFIVKPLFMFAVCLVIDTFLCIIVRATKIGYLYSPAVFLLVAFYSGFTVYEVAKLKGKKVGSADKKEQGEDINL